LNLELRISPPWQDKLHDERNLRFGRVKYRCSACRFGFGNGKECSCNNVKCQTEDSSSSSYSSTDISSSIGYDFLGLNNTRVLDFSTLEMK
jgi:myb proto-oncogene protein